MGTLYVINPNSSRTVTEGIDAAIAPLRALGTEIECLTLAEGPPGIESQAQADAVVPPLLALAERLEPAAAGFVIACFGDPGLHALRDRTAKPTLGIQECSVVTALTLGQRFGVISILSASIPRHMRAFGAMGVMDRLAGDRALGLGVAELADATTTRSRMEAVGADLRDRDGADVLVMGCAGMARYRDPLEAALGIPVVEPCQAAVAMALGRIPLGQTHRPGDRHAR
ncbi:aspartate/glutamate racemase family protein [Roseibacterium sp. SDUM158017]|uniref:aspartate/glutamate racemase family protein n=1 Tax=Roseicyclus salinarum TaxID=3036773 RepID=UPI0024157D42|nr:aspartate/glutamate racemase family protein [Roseibacterium sp. SDUM158017]MDG4647749.1 aspartate/glutamate racemase family protein [Roseibacterium sp. SDUM158017]